MENKYTLYVLKVQYIARIKVVANAICAVLCLSMGRFDLYPLELRPWHCAMFQLQSSDLEEIGWTGKLNPLRTQNRTLQTKLDINFVSYMMYLIWALL